ncbi:Os06g0188875 [Oryza sativa Japonica Group]|uniref:Os06g0188875 protein n=1 Tax=Oryza sativa subsp. japonica TaxID=39947 RepID=A0A0P0WU11_ORYSJ|nr:Os06g0188875 [Oryza sativa Japonica Group]
MFLGCSIIQITKAVNRKKITVANQSSFVSGFKNTHSIFYSDSFSASTSIETPDSVYGIVNSTWLARSAIMVISPTAASLTPEDTLCTSSS